MSIVLLALPLCLGSVDVNFVFSLGTQIVIWHRKWRKGLYGQWKPEMDFTLEERHTVPESKNDFSTSSRAPSLTSSYNNTPNQNHH